MGLIRIASRASPLAIAQAKQVGHEIQKIAPNISLQYIHRESKGDMDLISPLWKMPEKGVFTEDFVEGLKNNEFDLVVHSWKDLPTEPRSATEVTATLKRADPRDLLLLKKNTEKKTNLKIHSSSPRREKLWGQISELIFGEVKPTLFIPVRGNMLTRFQKTNENPEIDGIILAKAAFDRLLDATTPLISLSELNNHWNWTVLPISQYPTAPAQGALAIEVDKKNLELKELLKKINCESTFSEVTYERNQLAAIGGGCHQAVGIYKKKYENFEFISEYGSNTNNHSSIHWYEFPNLQISEFWCESLTSKSFFSKIPIKLSDVDIERLTQFPIWYITHISAWTLQIRDIAKKVNPIIWCAGLSTFRKLRDLGIWVHGSDEGLGSGNWPVGIGNLRTAFLTHQELLTDPKLIEAEQFATYFLKKSLTPSDMNALKQSWLNCDLFYWKSPSQFQYAVSFAPEILHKRHACGPGKTYKYILSALSETNPPLIFKSESGFLEFCRTADKK